jgi:hypothetical protein
MVLDAFVAGDRLMHVVRVDPGAPLDTSMVE